MKITEQRKLHVSKDKIKGDKEDLYSYIKNVVINLNDILGHLYRTINYNADLATYTDEDVQEAINNDADHGSTASHNYFSGSHNDLTDVGTNDHHTKTGDNEVYGLILSDTKANRPAPGIAERYFYATDEGILYYDDGAAWSKAAVNDHGDLDGIGASDHHTKTDKTEHDGWDHSNVASSIAHNELSSIGADDHHSRYTDAEAQTAINNDADHGSTAPHNYFSKNPSDLNQEGAEEDEVLTWKSGAWTPDPAGGSYTDSDAIDAINNDADHGSTAQHDYFSKNPSDLNQEGAEENQVLTWKSGAWTDRKSTRLNSS